VHWELQLQGVPAERQDVAVPPGKHCKRLRSTSAVDTPLALLCPPPLSAGFCGVRGATPCKGCLCVCICDAAATNNVSPHPPPALRPSVGLL